MSAKQWVFSLLALLPFIAGFIGGLIAAYFRKKRLETGKLDWQKYQKTRKSPLKVLVVGAVLASLPLSSFITDVGPLTLIGLKVHIVVENVFFFFGLLIGMLLLGLGLGLGWAI